MDNFYQICQFLPSEVYAIQQLFTLLYVFLLYSAFDNERDQHHKLQLQILQVNQHIPV